MIARLTALALMAMLAWLPLTILPEPFLGALAALALAVGGAGALAPNVSLATAGGMRWAMRVPSIRPGATQFTVMVGASATARQRVRWINAALLAA